MTVSHRQVMRVACGSLDLRRDCNRPSVPFLEIFSADFYPSSHVRTSCVPRSVVSDHPSFRQTYSCDYFDKRYAPPRYWYMVFQLV